MNEWYVCITLRNGATLYWSARFKMWTALVPRAAFYSSEKRARLVLRKLQEENPGEFIEVRRVG